MNAPTILIFEDLAHYAIGFGWAVAWIFVRLFFNVVGWVQDVFQS